ncbi:hypothetical protein PGB90_009276 [Kerria lacca]
MFDFYQQSYAETSKNVRLSHKQIKDTITSRRIFEEYDVFFVQKINYAVNDYPFSREEINCRK